MESGTGESAITDKYFCVLNAGCVEGHEQKTYKPTHGEFSTETFDASNAKCTLSKYRGQAGEPCELSRQCDTDLECHRYTFNKGEDDERILNEICGDKANCGKEETYEGVTISIECSAITNIAKFGVAALAAVYLAM